MTEQQLPFQEDTKATRWETLERDIAKHEANGDVAKAQIAANEVLTEARSKQNRANSDIAPLLLVLEVRGDFAQRIGKFRDAKADYLEAISLVAGQSGYESTLGRLYGSLARAMEGGGDSQQAIDAYKRAIEQLERERETPVVEIVRYSNSLAFLVAEQDDFDQAETLFLKALELSHSELGESDENTTAIANNVGNLYQRAEHFEQAEKMLEIALQGREKAGGPKDPDTAQTQGNLAAVYMLNGSYDKARELFDKAVTTFSKLGKDYREDLDAVASNYLQLLEHQKDSKRAAKLRKLLKK